MLDAQTMEAHQKKRLLSREENMHNVKRKKKRVPSLVVTAMQR